MENLISMLPTDNLVINWVISPLAFLIVTGFIIGQFFPIGWILVERMWLRVRLGGSTASRLARDCAEEDFISIIKQKQIDDNSPRSVAILLAIWTRIREYAFRGLTDEYRNLKNENIQHIYESAIKNLNEGWRLGLSPTILEKYEKTIMDSAIDQEISDEAKIRGRGSVSVVRYALGDIKKGYKIAKQNWDHAEKLEKSGHDSELRWTASYGYFNSTMFLGRFENAMELMANQWSKYYAGVSDDEKWELKRRLGDRLILNPILSIPRHITLAAAFNEKPLYEEKYFPSEEAYEKYMQNNKEDGDITNEILWVNSWYEEALKVCEETFDGKKLSLNFSHAYSAFYLTLLFLDPKTPKNINLCEKIRTAFAKIDKNAPIPSLYVKNGFYGVFHLIHKNNEKALSYLRKAAQFSSISGNSFADCLFQCCHALAAARLNKYEKSRLEPEVEEFLEKSRQLSKRIGGKFYPALSNITHGAVRLLQGRVGEAQIHYAKVARGSVGKRIQSIFLENEDN